MHQIDKSIIQSLKQVRASLRTAMTPELIQQTAATFGGVREQLATTPALTPTLELLAAEFASMSEQPSGELTDVLTSALGAVEKFLKSSTSPDSLAQLEYAHGALQNALAERAPHNAAAAGAEAVEPETAGAETGGIDATMEAEEAEMLDGLIHDFLVESYENLDQLDRDLVALEQDPTSESKLASIFRTIHTIKGTCGFFGYSKLESVAHVGESLLSRMRDGKVILTAEIATALLLMVDAVRQMLGSIENERNEGDADYTKLIADLTRLQQIGGAAGAAISSVNETAHESVPETAPEATPVLAAVPVPDFASANAEPVIASEALVKSPAAPLALAAAPPADTSAQNENRGPSVADNSIRVDVGLLDVLMNLVGELVLARNQILQFTSSQSDAGFVATSQRLNLITSELQEGVMKTRLQPIGNIWSKFPRVVRDLAVACGKKIRIDLEGKETEMDKTIIEAIKDPLTHLVRNSADHGIELPEVRRAKGKPSEGHISLRAYHEGGQVNIEISDDGAGIDIEKVKSRAVQRGLITGEQAARMTEREATHLIFLPGFSTAEKVTNISGRGVGMDVVRTNIEKIGGTLDIHNRQGHGTTIRIKIPLTLAIIPALIITSAKDYYAIPQVSLLELVRLEGEQAQTSIEMIYGTPVYRLRGNLLPLVYLNRELQVEPLGQSKHHDRAVNIVVLRADDRQFGLVVDEINDTEEIVVKPLSKQLKGITAFAGATIMGDGKVALILDVMGIAQRAHVVTEVRDRAIAEKAAQISEDLTDRQTLLLFQLGQDGRMAIPLSEVARLEEFPVTAVEKAWQQEVVQYRGHVMPLLRLSDIFKLEANPQANASDMLQVVVYSGQHRSVGLVVEQILDIVEESVTNQHRSQQPGVWGTAVIQQRVTDLLDVQGLIESHMPDSLAQLALNEGEAGDLQALTATHALIMNAQPGRAQTIPAR